MPKNSRLRPAIDALRQANERHGATVNYNRVWKLIAEGRVPATRLNGRWYIAEEHQAALEEALGLATPVVA